MSAAGSRHVRIESLVGVKREGCTSSPIGETKGLWVSWELYYSVTLVLLELRDYPGKHALRGKQVD